MFGNDLVDGCTQPAPTPCACAARCASHPTCRGWTFIKPNNTWCPGGCFLKNTPLPVLRPDPAMVSGVLPPRATPDNHTSTLRLLTATAMSATGCNVEDNMGRYGEDLLDNGCGNTVGSADACCAQCQARGDCVAWTWVKHTSPSCARGMWLMLLCLLILCLCFWCAGFSVHGRPCSH